MKMQIGSDRKMPDLDEKGRRPVYGFDLFYALTAVFLLLIGSLAFLVGMSYALEQSCDGYLVGSPFKYECYNQDLVGVCLRGDELVYGESFPFAP